jgi:hypothetical protein
MNLTKALSLQGILFLILEKSQKLQGAKSGE